jgi:hypothetical protein
MNIEVNERAQGLYEPLFKTVKVNLEIEIVMDETRPVREVVNNVVMDVEHESLTVKDFHKVKVVRATQLLEKPIERT